MSNLTGKVALVSGSGRGIGRAIALKLARHGAKVVVNDLDQAPGDAVAAEIRAAGGEAVAVNGDVTAPGFADSFVGAAIEKLGGLDIIVNNAGMPQKNGPMLAVDEATFDRIFAVNVKSIYLAALHAVPALERRGGGAVINTASTAGLRPRPGLVWYNGSKGAVISLTKAMAIELAPKKIRVNALCPVAGDTPMLGDFMGGDTPENRARFIASIPLGRLSTPADMANAALYLASDEGAFLTGVALEIDGGRCI